MERKKERKNERKSSFPLFSIIFDFLSLFFICCLALVPGFANIQFSVLIVAKPSTWKYHTHKELVKYLQDHEKHFPKLVKLHKIGMSKGGKEIYSVEITNNVGQNGVVKPNIGLLGMMHGYDVIGQELSLMLLHHLTKMFTDKNPRILKLLNAVKIHVIPTVNVDGLPLAQKGDCNGTLYKGNDFYNYFGTGREETAELEVKLLELFFFEFCR